MKVKLNCSSDLSTDVLVIFFVVGLLLQEIWEVPKQGFRIYFSKWWNIVDTITLSLFLAAYIVWLLTWLSVYEEWQPRKNAFIVADVLYASATVLAFFHLSHAFQVCSLFSLQQGQNIPKCD